MSKKTIALDADGVLLDYNLAYAKAWERAFGTFPSQSNPNAYWPMDHWHVQRLAGAALERFRAAFDEEFWSTLPAMPGAGAACALLQASGFELVCVTAMAERERFAPARLQNLQNLGFPIERVITTDNVMTPNSPKAQVLNSLMPAAFVDDFAPYLTGVDPCIHRALVMRDPDGSPNQGQHLQLADSQHSNLLEFALWWTGHR